MKEQSERKDIKLAEKALERLENNKKGTLRELLEDYSWQDVSQTIKMQTGLRLWEIAEKEKIKINSYRVKNGPSFYELEKK